MINPYPQYRYGISIGVSHYLSEALGKHPVFIEEEVQGDIFKKHVSPEAAKSIALRVFELTQTEPPVMAVPELHRTWMFYLRGEKLDFMSKFVSIVHVDGPLDAVQQVGVPEDSDDFYPLNRIDKVKYED